MRSNRFTLAVLAAALLAWSGVAHAQYSFPPDTTDLDSPAFTGTPTINGTALGAGTALPLGVGLATGPSVGTSGLYARQDHVHANAWDTDFPNTVAGAPGMWTGATIGSGTVANAASTANHPGIVRISASATADSGYYFKTGNLFLLLAGSEETSLVFSVVTTAASTIRFGFIDTTTVAAPTDGCYIKAVATTLSGHCANNTTITDTGTTYTITQGSWYRAKVAMNADATLATFTLYSEAGAVLWTSTVATNIPTAAGRQTGHGVVATNTSGSTTVDIVDVDYMRMAINRALTR